MDGRLHIKLQIAGRYYPLIIERDEEEKFRQAATLINEKVSQYQQRYNDKDGQDFLAMAALQLVLRMTELEEMSNDNPLLEAVNNLVSELDIFFQEKQAFFE